MAHSRAAGQSSSRHGHGRHFHTPQHHLPHPHSHRFPPRRRSRSPVRNHHQPSEPPRDRSPSYRAPYRRNFEAPRGRVWDRDRDRDREAARPADFFDVAPLQQNRRAFIENPVLPRPRPGSPEAINVDRERSQSPLIARSRHRRTRHEPSPPRPDRDPYAARPPTWPAHSRASSPRQDHLVRRGRDQQRLDTILAKPNKAPFLGRGRPSSPLPGQGFDENPNLVPLGQRPASRHDHNPLSFSDPRRPSPPPRVWTPPLQGRLKPYIEHAVPQGRPAREFNHDWSPPPPSGSPARERRGPFPSNKKDFDRRRYDEGPPEPIASGANSVEVNMSARGNFRGAYGGQYPVRGHYNPGPNDPRNFTHSSGSTPSSSFQGSPTAQSPYPSSRGSWGGQQQLSPQKSVVHFPYRISHLLTRGTVNSSLSSLKMAMPRVVLHHTFRETRPATKAIRPMPLQ